MGLRHLFVVSSRPKVIGLLSRKDVIKENAMLVLGEKANMGLEETGKVEGAQNMIRLAIIVRALSLCFSMSLLALSYRA